MAVDAGAFLRLEPSIDAVRTRLDDTTNAKALSDACATFRCEAAQIAEEEGVPTEVDRLFPAANSNGARPSVSQGFDPFAAVNEARAVLARPSGGLDGFGLTGAPSVSLPTRAASRRR